MKKRTLLIFLLVLFSTWLTLLYLPWWFTIVNSFLLVLFLQKDKKSATFLLCGLAGAIIWIGIAIFTDIQNDFILSAKMATLFHLPSSKLLWLIEAIIGFVSAGLGGWLGKNLKFAFQKNRTESK